MGMLLILFGISIATATFIENDFGTVAAKTVVYNATWFEVLLVMLIVNMVGVIFTKKLYQKSKIPSLLLHVAFIVIIIGAAITRFFSFEGIMHIREGESTNTYVSNDIYVQVDVTSGTDNYHYKKNVLFSNLVKNKFKKSFESGSSSVSVELKVFIPRASQVLSEDPEGSMYLTVVIAGSAGRQNKFVRENEIADIGGIHLSFGDTTHVDDIHVIIDNGNLLFRAPAPISYISMNTQEQGELESNMFHPFQMRNLYTINDVNFVLSDFTPNGKLKLVSMPRGEGGMYDAVVFSVSDKNTTEDVVVMGGKGIIGEPVTINISGTNVSISYGSLLEQVPFTIELVDFQLDRYPGSESPASFASEVIVHDYQRGITKPFRIFMNNILNYRGYRFFQSSYDKDELGTILSLNHDFWGTLITYIGYAMLAAGLIAVLFSRNTRFSQLSKLINEIHHKRKSITAAVVFIIAFAGINPNALAVDPGYKAIDREHAARFGALLYQKNDGRMVPINTLISNLVRKITKKITWDELTPEQVFLGMMTDPEKWQGTPMIKVGDEGVMKLLGISGKYARFDDFFDAQGNYKLKNYVDEVFAKNPSERSRFDKDILAVDERANIVFMIYQGSFLKVFPIPEHSDNNWASPFDDLTGMNRDDSLFVRIVFTQYFNLLAEADSTGNYKEADDIIMGIGNYQKHYGAEVIPPASKIKFEILYNKLYLFKRLFPYYTLVGFMLLIVLFVELLNPRIQLRKIILFLGILIIAGFAVHTAGLILRWYIAGRAPWSNGFESMIYIAWTGLLAGILFKKKSPITLSVTAILAGIMLMVAHLNWMDPEITNLVPVLRSYWLTIHVSAITASYGFLGLGALLAFMSLIIMILKNKENHLRLDLTVQELSFITEMTLTAGLVLLTIGNFLGGVWANESWGRYWGWDAKETWALTTIIVYAFILHMRFIPGLKGFFAFNFATVIGFGSVLMTYFGVNYYLSGLHSYAAGDPLPIPTFVYYMVFTIGLVSLLAWFNENRNKDKELKADVDTALSSAVIAESEKSVK